MTKIEDRTDISDDAKVKKIIIFMSIFCGVVAAQPIPIADFFILTPLQAIMGSRIATVRGVPISIEKAFTNPKKAFMLIWDISLLLVVALIAQQVALGAYKTILPFWGALTTVPLVGLLTYVIGRSMDSHLIRKARSQLTDPETLKGMWKKPKKSGKNNT